MFRKKCEYCREKVDKGREICRKVKDPVLVELKEKTFCSDEHADSYHKQSMNAKKCESGCCG